MKETKLVLYWHKNGIPGNMYIYGRGIADIRRQSIKEIERLGIRGAVLLNPGSLTIHGDISVTGGKWFYMTQTNWPGFRIGKDGKRI